MTMSKDSLGCPNAGNFETYHSVQCYNDVSIPRDLMQNPHSDNLYLLDAFESASS
jgi:hypothetical protein